MFVCVGGGETSSPGPKNRNKCHMEGGGLAVFFFASLGTPVPFPSEKILSCIV